VSRRGLTLLLAFVLAIGLAVAGAFTTVPYAALTPGPAFNTLGAVNGKKVLAIGGHGEFKDTGSLSLTTVSVQDHITLLEALRGWLSSSEAVVPREVVFPPAQTAQQAEQENVQQMLQSQNSATTAAFKQLGIPTTKAFAVGAIKPGSPAASALKVGDVLMTIDGQPVTAQDAVGALIGKRKAGETVVVGYSRDGKAATATITTAASTDKPIRPVIGISVEERNISSVTVDITLDDVGGPSAGLMFALGIVDKLGTESLTGGKRIAGTGEISNEGKVGAIGGIAQKMRGAKARGATIFLVPSANCKEAKDNKPSGITLVKVSTLQDALASLKTLRSGGTPTSC
jgi:PDZ domain-containing protein